MPIVLQNVYQGTHISSDELRSYNSLNAAGYEHGTVNHASGQFKNGDDHTQTIDGFWSRLKLSIRGTHIWVSADHLQRYVDEFSFRYNLRNQPAMMFDRLLLNLPKHV